MKVGAVHLQQVNALEWPLAEIARQRHPPDLAGAVPGVPPPSCGTRHLALESGKKINPADVHSDATAVWDRYGCR